MIPWKEGCCTIVQAPKSFFRSPLCVSLSWKLNFPEWSVLSSSLSSELTGVGGHFQRGAFQQAGSATPGTMPLASARAGGAVLRQNRTFAYAQVSPSHWGSALSFPKCLHSQTLFRGPIPGWESGNPRDRAGFAVFHTEPVRCSFASRVEGFYHGVDVPALQTPQPLPPTVGGMT